MRVQVLVGAALMAWATSASGFHATRPHSEREGGQSAAAGGESQRIESVVVESSGEAVEVEWLFWADGQVRTVSQVPFTSTPAKISFRRSPFMYLRFTRNGQSPFTLSTLAVPKATLFLPNAIAGGEIVVRQPAATILPSKYSLVKQGTTVDMIPDGFGNFSFRGVPPGSYLLRGEYPGGLRSADDEILIASSQSVIIVPVPEAVGGISLTVSDERCFQTQELRISEVRTVRGGGTAKSAPLVTLAHKGTCSRPISGMPPGTYSVELVDVTLGLSMIGEVDVWRQRLAELDFTRPLPWINGRVTLRATEFPSAGASIVFRPTQSDTRLRQVMIPIQAAGAFSSWLPEAGTYWMNLSVGGMIVLGSQRVVVVHGGANHVDWDIDGSVVTVKIVDWDRTAPLSLELLRSSGTTTLADPVSTQWQLEPASATLPVRIPGLAPGGYSIQAWLNPRGKDPVVSDVLRFDIGNDEASRELELALRPYILRITLRNQMGALVRGAEVDSYQGTLKETEPGTYVSGSTPIGPGAKLEISANGFTPICRYAPGSGTLDITMGHGVTQVVQFVGEPLLPIPEGAILWPGSDCRVPLSRFSTSLVARHGDSSVVTFEMRNFPLVPGLTWTPATGGVPVPVAASDDGIVRLVVSRRGQR